MNNIAIKFRFKDELTRGEWQIRTAECPSVQAAIDFYGLNEPGVEYEILEIDGKNPDTGP